MSTNPKIDPVVEPAPEPTPVSPRSRTRRAITRTTIFVALYFSILVYPVVRLLGLLMPAWTPGTPELLAIIVLPIVCRVLYERYPTPATRTLAGVALTWLGVCFQLFWIMLIFELINCDRTVARRKRPASPSRRRHRRVVAGRLRQRAAAARETRTDSRPNDRTRPQARADQRRTHRIAQPAPAAPHR